jgi:eukaryotic-like serine/threonine-protein kinase
MAPAPESESSDATIVAGVSAEHSFASGRYVVRRVLPEGGQKTVYVVHDTALDRECALALIKTDALEPEELERLRREAQAMARLDHPNIVAVYDIGEEDGRPFFVCQYITGGDLREELRAAGGPLPIERTLGIAEDLCRALASAHEHGIVHRDVKPANVLLTGEGTAKLGDFGLATAADRSRLTLSGAVVGTAAYIAPEQAMGQPADVRSDLYALGCVLYEMVCGRPPFSGDDALAVISQHVNTAPVDPSWHNPAVPKPLEALVLRLLAKAPDERPASAQEVAQELRRIIELSAVEPSPSPQPQAATDLRGLDWGRFVGRGEEMEQLKDALDGALSGKAALIFVAGEPGIGKTRLAEEFAVYAGLRGAHVLSGRAYEGGSSLPYTPFVEALRQYTRSRPDGELRAQLGPGAPEVATLVSEIRARFPDIQEAPRLEPEAERLRLFESVTEFLRNASAAGPIVLHLDDLHWADKPSLLLLQHLAQRTARDRLLVLGAYRDVELARGHPLSETLGALRRLPNYRRVLLRGLPQESVNDLLTAIDPSEAGAAGRQALAAALYRETEGNPFFIHETLAHLVETGKIVHEGGRWVPRVTSVSELGIPEGAREVIGRRLSLLSDGCNRMLTLASTMTGGFTWDALKAINPDVPEAQLLDLLEEALATQLISERKEEGAGRYDFTHALIRQTLYEELSTPRRVLLHRQIGEALERLYAANVEPHVTELAHHFYQAAPGGDVEKAIDYARRAGDRSVSLVAWEEAAAHYERALQALELLPIHDERRQAELLLALGDALSGGGDRERYKEAFARAADVARRIGDSGAFARAALGFASPFPVVDPQIIGLLEEALDLLAPGDSALRAMVTARLAQALHFGDQRERMTALKQEALAMARRVGDRAALTYTLGRILLGAAGVYSRPAQFTDLIDEAIRLAQETGNKRAESQGYIERAIASLALGERDAADAAIDVHERLIGELRTPGFVKTLRAMQARLDGRLDAVEALAQQGLVDLQRVDPQLAQGVFGGQMLDLRRAQGRVAELEGAVKALAAQFPLIPAYRAALALVYEEEDRCEEIRAVFDELANDDFAVIPDDGNRLISLIFLTDVCCYLDDQPRAAALYEMLLPLADQCIVFGPASGCAGSASAPLGALAATLGRFDDAERHFEDAIAMNRKLRAPTWVAQAQLGYAQMLLDRESPGDRERALELLQLALDAGQRMGMKKLVEDCLALRAKVG